MLAALGAALLLLLALDIFITVFHPEGHGGPLTRLQNAAVWRLWKAVAPSGDRGDAWLGYGGPVLAVLAPTVWALLLLVGFALIYHPWMARFLVSPGGLRAHWVEALYYSGFTAATLGTGDLVPDLVALRLVTILQAMTGFALLSAALSYILAIYRENGRKTTLASELALHWGSRESGDRAAAVAAERGRWLEEVARELVHVTQAHAQYPILHYFRATDPRNSLALQLAPLVRLATASTGDADGALTRDAPTSHAPTSRAPTPGALLVAEAVERYLTAADERFVRGVADVADAAGAGLEGRYRRLLDYLGYAPDAHAPA